MTVKAEHGYIERTDGRVGGRAAIKGTRIPVWAVVELYQSGLTPEEILAHYLQLTLSRIFDALGYFDDHRREIEEDIAANQPKADKGITGS